MTFVWKGKLSETAAGSLSHGLFLRFYGITHGEWGFGFIIRRKR